MQARKEIPSTNLFEIGFAELEKSPSDAVSAPPLFLAVLYCLELILRHVQLRRIYSHFGWDHYASEV